MAQDPVPSAAVNVGPPLSASGSTCGSQFKLSAGNVALLPAGSRISWSPATVIGLNESTDAPHCPLMIVLDTSIVVALVCDLISEQGAMAELPEKVELWIDDTNWPPKSATVDPASVAVDVFPTIVLLPIVRP